MNYCQIYLLIDEIDHITIRYREQGKPLERKNGIDKVLYCVRTFPEVKTELADCKTDRASLEALPDTELHDILVRTRTVLLGKKAGF